MPFSLTLARPSLSRDNGMSVKDKGLNVTGKAKDLLLDNFYPQNLPVIPVHKIYINSTMDGKSHIDNVDYIGGASKWEALPQYSSYIMTYLEVEDAILIDDFGAIAHVRYTFSDSPRLECSDFLNYNIKGKLMLHRNPEEGPALTTSDGWSYYYVLGFLHREDGPALIQADGNGFNYRYGVIDGASV